MRSCSMTDLLVGSSLLSSSPSLAQTMLAGGLESTRQLRVAVRRDWVREVVRERWTVGWSANTGQSEEI